MNRNLNEVTFDEWIECIFDHPVTTDPWYYDDANYPHLLRLLIDPQIIIEYIIKTFEHIDELPKLYSDEQIKTGLELIINPSCSNFMTAVFDVRSQLEPQQVVACIDSIYYVFKNLFAERCTPQVHHLDNPNISPLNEICYMWWSLMPIYGESAGILAIESQKATLSVLKKILELKSVPCRESALHCLYESQLGNGQETIAMINRFLVDNPEISSQLRDYAQKAYRRRI